MLKNKPLETKQLAWDWLSPLERKRTWEMMTSIERNEWFKAQSNDSARWRLLIDVTEDRDVPKLMYLGYSNGKHDMLLADTVEKTYLNISHFFTAEINKLIL